MFQGFGCSNSTIWVQNSKVKRRVVKGIVLVTQIMGWND
jgi:hypothetical protein